MQLQTERFAEQFERFKQLIRKASGQDFTSFTEGLAAEWEEYKGPLRQEALSRLGIEQWSSEGLSDGKILAAAIDAIEIEDAEEHPRNNLVRWENTFGHANRSHRALLDAKLDAVLRKRLEGWLFRFFRDQESDAESFEEFRQLAGNRYDLVAYFFYLKDSDRFMPIAPETFDKAFELLGIELKTSGECSWENYSFYNHALMEIRDALRDREALKNVRLIDAHSFCWTLIRVESELVSSKVGQSKQVSTKANPVIDYNALQKSIWEMADYAEKAALNSGKTVLQTTKLKELHLSKEDLMCYIEKLIQKQEGRCALTGIPLQYTGEHDDEQRLASLDRIDSKLKYPLIFTRSRRPGRRLRFGLGVLDIAR
jgi:hypothetical protein